jgi:methylmalonyl-CoA epimerase
VTPILRGVRHIGVAVRDLDAAARVYAEAFGVEVRHHPRSDSEGLRAASFRIGEVEIELMEALRDDSPVGRFIAKRGEGVHHIAYAVEDVGEALSAAREAGLEPLDVAPREGLDGTRIAFIHPKSVNGVLTELVQDG